jgi:Uma2 family endonuclease
MSALAHAAHHTFRDYLALEASGNVKHEFYKGEIYAMAGGTPVHAALQVAVPSLLFPQIRGSSCRAHGADLRVRVLATGLATYPDVTIVCGPRELDPEDANTVVNPTLLVEVLSPSTAEYDRGGKFENYKLIPSLRHYVLVSSDERRLEVWSRGTSDEWTLRRSLAGGVAELPAIGARLSVDELYDAAGALS